MKLLTHTAFGLFLGTLFCYFLDFDFSFILLSGFAAFLPDIDWRMQYSWHMGNVHRKVLHNVWFLSIITILTYLSFGRTVFGIVIGFLSHLIADSFTVAGVYWLYPLGRKSGKYFLNGSLSMNTPTAIKVEKYLQITFFTLSGFLFIVKEITLENIFSMEGIITIAVILAVGFYLYKALGKTLKRIIREMGL